MQAKVDELARFLDRQGARVAKAMPALDVEQYLRDYLCLLVVQTTVGRSREEREARARALALSPDFMLAAHAPGFTLDAAGLVMLLRRREEARSAWRRFFQDFDVLIGPTALDAAFPHQTGAFETRTLLVDGEPVSYVLNIVYPMWAIFAGQPSTAFPAGTDGQGLPLGLQAIGPYLEDRTTLRFAQLLEREWRGFEIPPGYAP
jgi:amidase